MEKNCHTAIKQSEANIKEENKEKREFEDKIAQLKHSHDTHEAIQLVLQKTFYDKAREKNKELVKTIEEEDQGERAVTDYLTPILQAKKLENRDLTAEEALMVKNEVMDKLRKRLLSRADIIARSLEQEKQALEQCQLTYQRKGESIKTEDTQLFQEEVQQHEFRIDILEQRAVRHEEMALERFTKMDQELMNDPRLAALKNLEKNS